MAHLLEGRPLELVREGRLVLDNLRRTQVSEDELLSQVRAHGQEDLRHVRSAWLEPNGRVSFLFRDGASAAPR